MAGRQNIGESFMYIYFNHSIQDDEKWHAITLLTLWKGITDNSSNKRFIAKKYIHI